MFNHSNYLSTNCLYHDRDKALAHHDGKNCAIPVLPTGTNPCQLPGSATGWAAPVNATSLNRRAVSFNLLPYCYLDTKQQ